jgi:hypothetical protein
MPALFTSTSRRPNSFRRQLGQGDRGLGRDPGHFAKSIIREILGLAFFDSLQNEAGDEFGLITIGVVSRGSATRWIAHPIVAKIRRRDEWVDFADDDSVLFQLGSSLRSAMLIARSRIRSIKC